MYFLTPSKEKHLEDPRINPMPKFYPRWLIKHYWLAKKVQMLLLVTNSNLTPWPCGSFQMSLEPLQTLFQTGQINRCTPLSIKLSSVVGQVEHCGSFLKRKSWWPGSNKLHQLLLSNNTIVERKFNFFLWSKNCQSVFTLGHLLVT